MCGINQWRNGTGLDWSATVLQNAAVKSRKIGGGSS